MRRLDLVLKEALRGLVCHRLMTVASVTTAAAALSLLGFVYVGALVINGLSARVLEKIETAAYTAKSVTPDQLDRLKSQIEAIPGVVKVTLITREQAWERQRRAFSHLPYLSKIKNPLTDEFWVRVANPEQTNAVATRIRSLKGIDAVATPSTVLSRAVAVAKMVRLVGIVMCAALLLAAALITSNAIRLSVFARRREIRIMQLVGATDGFIRMPFLIEGTVHGLLGAAVASVVLLLGVEHTVAFVRQTLPFLPLSLYGVSFRDVCLGIAGVGAGVGATASALSVGRFLRA
ncbi:MAG: permease-like cell division protein FtsX [Armatimonadota bacterium]